MREDFYQFQYGDARAALRAAASEKKFHSDDADPAHDELAGAAYL